MRPGSTILRWVLAPVGAAGAFGLGFIVGTALRLAILRVSETREISDGPDALAFFLDMMFAMIGWAWAGAAIAPAHRRTFAFVLFSVPPVLFALLFFLLFAAGRVTQPQVPMGLGAVAGCGGIVILGLIWRHRARAAEWRRTIEQTADVFSDEPDRVAEPR